MYKKDAVAIAGTLGNPSKMPGKSYGLPAEECKLGAILRKRAGSTCADCYALKGNYARYPDIKKGQYRRLAGIKTHRWIDAMVTLIGNETWFRWHDSGDLQSVMHLAKIVTVCKKTPKTRHWLPTRELKMVRQFLATGGKIPSNLVLRISAPMVDGPAPSGPWNTSTVHNKTQGAGHICPAPQQGNNCGDCRACWDNSVVNISYHIH